MLVAHRHPGVAVAVDFHDAPLRDAGHGEHARRVVAEVVEAQVGDIEVGHVTEALSDEPVEVRLEHVLSERLLVDQLSALVVDKPVLSENIVEHVKDVDHFIAETIRILTIGGVAVISTENGSSWHNIFAAVMGWQTFSLSSLSTRARSVGNPLALHRGDPPPRTFDKHRTIFNYRGLIEFLKAHGLAIVAARGAGYYPLPAGVGSFDLRHCHFITIKVRKVGSEASRHGQGQT